LEIAGKRAKKNQKTETGKKNAGNNHRRFGAKVKCHG
jgi:hypothetical protein